MKDPWWNLCLAAGDRLLGALVRPRASAATGAPPRRLLLSLGGHLGDAIISTRAIEIAAERFPGAEIGVLVGSWARVVIEGHPRVRWIHVVDHWKTSRRPVGMMRKGLQYGLTRARAVREIRGVGYDAAVDLYPFFPNTALLLRQARIPVRIGYASGGLGSFYTTALEWRDSGRHMAEYQVDLLDRLPGARSVAELPSRPDLPPIPAASARVTEQAVRASGVPWGEYVILHMGAGHAQKEWPEANWVRLARELAARGHVIVFTGVGPAESTRVRRVRRESRCGVDLCGKLDWHSFVHLVHGARAVVSVDSAAGHVAAAAGTPVVVLSTGISDPRHWAPLSPRSTVVTEAVRCSPCFRKQGCDTMECIRGVEVARVLEAVESLTVTGSSAEHAWTDGSGEPERKEAR